MSTSENDEEQPAKTMNKKPNMKSQSNAQLRMTPSFTFLLLALLACCFVGVTNECRAGADGKYRMPYAFSDEYGSTEEVSMHIGMARWGFATLMAIAERLKIDDPQIPHGRSIWPTWPTTTTTKTAS